MTADELKAARAALSHSQISLADALRVDERTIRRWESGAVPISGPASVAVGLMVRQHRALVARLQALRERGL